MGEYAREKARRAGVPFFYRDNLSRLVKEYPDGRRTMIVHEGEQEKEIAIES